MKVVACLARTLLLLFLTTFLSKAHGASASPSPIHGNIVSRWSSRRSLPTVIQTSASTSASASTNASRRSNVTTQEKSKPPLLSLLSADVLSAFISSALLSPLVTIIDKSVTLSAAGSMTLGSALKKNALTLISNPMKFVTSPEYVWICGLYSATYIAANTITTYCTLTSRPSSSPKLIGTTLVNIYACVSKDAAFAKMFGSCAPHSVPKRSLALFSLRDGGTIFSSFLLPQKLAAVFEVMGINHIQSLNVAQLTCPVVFQAVSAPIHLLGLDFYNRSPGELMGKTRMAASVDNYFPVVGARMLRVLPAFGIGGIGNRMLRAEMIKRIEGGL
ncbi:hypothetical protein TrST_g6725 [Triparma strigata]|uniref:Sequence orphan n=1 Tax=Triparma strigata TaxID=1606541 RepID=A0A9W7F0Y2_9STRA|nr:hypothetical protein TrST_g6725 [Triparma strigata]